MSFPQFPSFRRGADGALQSTKFSLPPQLSLQTNFVNQNGANLNGPALSHTPSGRPLLQHQPIGQGTRFPTESGTPYIAGVAEIGNASRRLAEQFQNGTGDNTLRENSRRSSVTTDREGGSSLDRVLDAMTHLMRQNATIIQSQAASMPNKSFHVMPDLTKSIGDFTGRETPAEAKRWLLAIETSANIHGWPEAFLYETATMHLTNAARSWYLSKKRPFGSWIEFREAFVLAFVPTINKSHLWDSLKMRKQRVNECIQDYFYDKVRLCSALDLDFEEVREQVATGLLSRELTVHVLTTEYHSVEKLFHGLLLFERTLKSCDPENSRKFKDIPAARFRKNPETEKPRDDSKENKDTVTSQNHEVKCFKCLKIGHYARRCPESSRSSECRRCGEAGHFAKNCTRPLPLDRGEIKIVSTTLPDGVCNEGTNGGVEGSMRSPSAEKLAKYLKTVRVNGITLNAMIDPGSSDCTIKASAVLCHGFDLIRLPSVLGGFGRADSQNLVSSCGIIRANIEVDGIQGDGVMFRVVPDDVQPTDLLIGRTFTELEHVAYVKVDDKLIFLDNATIELSRICPEVTRNDEGNLVTVRESVLSPAAVNLVEVKFEGTEVSLPLINFGDHPRCLREGVPIDASVMRIQQIEPQEQRVSPVEENEICVDEEVSPSQRQELKGLLNEFRDCVAKNIFELGKSSALEMDIQVKPGSVPVNTRPYKTNNEELSKIKVIVSEWKRAGIVRETSSAYASPVLLVSKKNGESRLVVDYHKLNAQTERIHFPIPNIDEYLEVLSGARIFATLDLAHGYLQLPLREEACAKTAFITPDDTGEFTRAMFGLMNAPFYFSKMMEMALGPLRNKILLFYLDDVLVLAQDWKELMVRLRAVLEALRGAGLTLKLSKCHFGKKRVEYLGFEVGETGIEPGAAKVEAIANFPMPTNVHETRRFIGMSSFFRRFVPKFATILAPLTELTRKDVEFRWHEKENLAFNKIKEILTSKPVLGIYNPKASVTELHTDASAEGLGAILFQKCERKELHPIFAISRRTSATERSYHSSKLELMALVWAVERLRVFLISLKFTIVTDCQALVYLNANKTTNPQVVRWTASLAEYDFEIKHRKGTAMGHVDALSRAPVGEPITDEMLERSQILRVNLREDELLLYQRDDETLKRKISILSKPRAASTKAELDMVKDYRLREGILYRAIERDGKDLELYVVPAVMRKAIAIKFHDCNSHFGIDKTLAKVQACYYFPRMRTYLKRHIAQCLECIISKKGSGPQAGELHSIPPGERPFAVVHIDHVGPFITSSRGSKYVLGLIDTLTKYVIFEPVKNTSAGLTVKKLEKIVNQFGAPVRIISDRGTSFTAKVFEEFCARHGIKHTLNSSRHPQANGLIERMNRTLLPAMIVRTEQGERIDWDSEIKMIERDVNSSVSKATGRTPFESLYGYQPRFEEGRVRELTLNCEVYRDPQEIREENRTKIENSQGKNKEYYDKHRRIGVSYATGEIVYVKVDPVATGESTKLQPRYRGPFVISKVLPNDTYVITRLTGGRKTHRPLTAHVSQLKLWRGRDRYSAPNSDKESSDDVSDEEEPFLIEIRKNNNDKDVPKGECELETCDDNKIISEIECERPQRTRRRPKYLQDYVSV